MQRFFCRHQSEAERGELCHEKCSGREQVDERYRQWLIVCRSFSKTLASHPYSKRFAFVVGDDRVEGAFGDGVGAVVPAEGSGEAVG